jgi:CrcB protein
MVGAAARRKADGIRSVTGYLFVFLGAGIGGALRHAVNLGCARACGITFPWGTLVVNLVGSLLMGALAAWLVFKAGVEWSVGARLFAATGILGGFTTFSAFSLDAVLLWERGASVLAILYVAASVLGSIGAALAGLVVVRALAS